MYYNKTGYDEKSNLFNKDIKEAFLKEKENYLKEKNKKETDNTISAMRGTLALLSKAERDFNKDMFEMNRWEFDQSLYVFQATTLKSMISRYSNLKSYDLWTYENGYTNGRPPITSFFKQDDLKKYLHHVPNFISYDELVERFSEVALNDQEIASALLAWEGLRGQSNIELRLLRKKDVHFETKTIDIRNLVNKDDENNKEDRIVRTIDVSNTTLEYVKKAIDEFEYKTKRIGKESGERVTHELAFNDYVFRQQVLKGEERNTTENDPMTSTAIARRIKVLAIDANKPWVTTQTLHQSGMLFRIQEIEDTKGYLEINDYKEVVKRYGYDESAYFSLKQLYLTRFNPNSVDKIL